MLRVSGAQKVLRLINTLRIQLITFWGSRFERKWMTPKMAQLVSPVSQKRMNKVLDIIEYMSGLLDSQ